MNRFEVTNEMVFEWEFIDYYSGNNCLAINTFLRGSNVFPTELCLKRISSMTKCIEKFRVPENVIVLRRIKNEYWNLSNKKGITIIQQAFLSTSLDLNFRKDFNGNFSNFKNETILLLKVPIGTIACYLKPISDRSSLNY